MRPPGRPARLGTRLLPSGKATGEIYKDAELKLRMPLKPPSR